MSCNSKEKNKKVNFEEKGTPDDFESKKIVRVKGKEYNLRKLSYYDVMFLDDDERLALYEACQDSGYEEYLYLFPESIEKDCKKEYELPISKRDAVEIAEKEENLIADFIKNSPNSPKSFSIRAETVNTAIKDEKEYWLVQVTECMFGGCYEIKGEECYYDGYFNEEQLDNLRCLIEKETGAYIYYPRVRKRKSLFQKLKDVVMRTETVVFDSNINMDIQIIKDPDDDDDEESLF